MREQKETQRGEHREVRTDACEKNGHLTEESGEAKHEQKWLTCCWLRLLQDISICSLTGPPWGVNTDVEGGRDGGVRWPASPRKLWLASTKRPTLMDLLTPYCRAAWQSPLTDLSSPAANPSISWRRDGPGGSIAFQSSYRGWESETRGERTVKKKKKKCEGEKWVLIWSETLLGAGPAELGCLTPWNKCKEGVGVGSLFSRKAVCVAPACRCHRKGTAFRNGLADEVVECDVGTLFQGTFCWWTLTCYVRFTHSTCYVPSTLLLRAQRGQMIH